MFVIFLQILILFGLNVQVWRQNIRKKYFQHISVIINKRRFNLVFSLIIRIWRQK